MNEQDEIYIQEIDVDKGEKAEKVKWNNVADFYKTDYVNRLENIASTDSGFLYRKNNVLFEFNYKTQEIKELFQLSSYGSSSSDILFLSKNNDTYEIIDNYGNSDHSEFILFTKGVNDKKTVTLGVTMAVQDLDKTVSEFNRV